MLERQPVDGPAPRVTKTPSAATIRYRGYSKSALAAAREYIALRMACKPVFLCEIAAKYGLQNRPVASAFRAIIREEEVQLPTCLPDVWIHRFSDELKLPDGIRNEAINICQSMRRQLFGRDPIGNAAAAIYWACFRPNCIHYGIRLTQIQMAKVTDISEVTIRNRYKAMSRFFVQDNLRTGSE